MKEPMARAVSLLWFTRVIDEVKASSDTRARIGASRCPEHLSEHAALRREAARLGAAMLACILAVHPVRCIFLCVVELVALSERAGLKHH